MTDKKAITITAEQKKGEYRDVVVAARLLSDRYGSAVNALVQMVRSSPEYLSLVRSRKLKKRTA